MKTHPIPILLAVVISSSVTLWSGHRSPAQRADYKPFPAPVSLQVDANGDVIVKGKLIATNIVAAEEVIAPALRLNVVTGGSVTLTATNSIYLLSTHRNIVTLPNAIGISGRLYTIKLVSPATLGLITNFTGDQLIDGDLSYLLSESNQFVTLISDNANWRITASK